MGRADAGMRLSAEGGSAGSPPHRAWLSDAAEKPTQRRPVYHPVTKRAMSRLAGHPRASRGEKGDAGGTDLRLVLLR